MPSSLGKNFTQALDRYEVLQNIFNSIQDGILIVDEEENIIYANASAGRLLGIPQEDLQRLKAEELPLSMFSRGGKEIPKAEQPFEVSLRTNPLGRPQKMNRLRTLLLEKGLLTEKELEMSHLEAESFIVSEYLKILERMGLTFVEFEKENPSG